MVNHKQSSQHQRIADEGFEDGIAQPGTSQCSGIDVSGLSSQDRSIGVPPASVVDNPGFIEGQEFPILISAPEPIQVVCSYRP
jgi:hypothetical protein